MKLLPGGSCGRASLAGVLVGQHPAKHLAPSCHTPPVHPRPRPQTRKVPKQRNPRATVSRCGSAIQLGAADQNEAMRCARHKPQKHKGPTPFLGPAVSHCKHLLAQWPPLSGLNDSRNGCGRSSSSRVDTPPLPCLPCLFSLVPSEVAAASDWSDQRTRRLGSIQLIIGVAATAMAGGPSDPDVACRRPWLGAASGAHTAEVQQIGSRVLAPPPPGPRRARRLQMST